MSKIAPSEKEIISGIRKGDKKALEICFRLYSEPLFAYAKTLIKHSDNAREIVQDTFIRLWENHELVSIDHSLRSYLFSMIHNNCINHLKHLQVLARQRNSMVSELTYHLELAVLDMSEETLNEIISKETEQIITHAIDELPDQCREIFTLSRFEQLTYTEIARKKKISVNTVKTQMTRAFEKIREKLKKSEKI